MADTSVYLGMVPQPGRWHSGVKLGGVNAIPIEFEIDTQLPSLGQDMYHPNRDFVVVPRGRIVAGKPTDLTRLSGKTVVTLANGVSPLDPPSFAAGNYPIGYAPFHFYRMFSGLPSDRPVPVRYETIEVPYTAVNEAYNLATNGGTRLLVGECVMAYYGSANNQTPIPQDKGKIVRFIEKRTYTTTVATASAQVILTSATFPAFKPTIVIAFTDTGAIITSGATLTYNNGESKWWASFASPPIKHVVYTYGADKCQCIGQIVGIEPVGTAGGINASTHEMHGWLKWVTDQFGLWDWPPILSVRPTQSVTDEVVSIDANNLGNLANFPVVPFKPITVAVTGSYIKADGTVQPLNGALGLVAPDYFVDYSQGELYDIDFLSGRIRFAANVTVVTCKVSYFYENDFRDGLLYDRGIFGLTDGRDSGIIGLPPHLDIAGVRGAMRVMIY